MIGKITQPHFDMLFRICTIFFTQDVVCGWENQWDPPELAGCVDPRGCKLPPPRNDRIWGSYEDDYKVKTISFPSGIQEHHALNRTTEFSSFPHISNNNNSAW